MNQNWSSTCQLLLAFADPTFNIRTVANERDMYIDFVRTLDDAEFVRLARQHRISALIGWRATYQIPNLLPDSARVPLLQDLLINSRRNESLFSESARLLASFAAIGARVLPRKGLVVATRYPTEGCRQLGDMDFLVPREHAKQVTGVAAALGYKIGKVSGSSGDVRARSRHDLLFWQYFIRTEPMMFRRSDNPWLEHYALDFRTDLLELNQPGRIDVSDVISTATETGSFEHKGQWDLRYLALDVCVHARRESDVIENADSGRALILGRIIDALLIWRDQRFDHDGFRALVALTGCDDAVHWVVSHAKLFFPNAIPSNLDWAAGWSDEWETYGVYEGRSHNWSSKTVERWFK